MTTNNKELRGNAAKIEVRSSNENMHVISGMIKYNSRSQPLSGFVEVIRPRAFEKSLRTEEVFVYWAHDDTKVLARQKNGTLRIQDTPTALLWEADITTETTWGNDAYVVIRDKLVTNNSFGFSLDGSKDDDSWTNEGGQITRYVNSALLWEVSPVGVPAYQANVTTLLRNAPEDIKRALGQQASEDFSTGDDDLYCDECCSMMHSACRSTKQPCSLCLNSVINRCERCKGIPDSADDQRSLLMQNLVTRLLS